MKAKRRRLGEFTKISKRVRGRTSWGSYMMLLVIVLGQYYTVLLARSYYRRGTHFNPMKYFCRCHLNILTFLPPFGWMRIGF